jgi:hypothetical protein
MLAYNVWRWIKLTAGIRPEDKRQHSAEKTKGESLEGDKIVNHTIRIARLKMLFLPAKITTHSGKTEVQYSSHDARAAELLDFLAYLDKRRKENRSWEDVPATCLKQAS